MPQERRIRSDPGSTLIVAMMVMAIGAGLSLVVTSLALSQNPLLWRRPAADGRGRGSRSRDRRDLRDDSEQRFAAAVPVASDRQCGREGLSRPH